MTKYADKAPLDVNGFHIGERVSLDLPINKTDTVRLSGKIGGITFDHVVRFYAIVLDEPLTRAKYPTLEEKYEGWFSFSVPSGWLSSL